MPDDDDREDVSEGKGRKKKKHPLGKLLQEFKPKSMQLEMGVAAGALLLAGLGGLVAAIFASEWRVALLLGGGACLVAGLATGYLCLGGPSSDYVQIRKLGLELRMDDETIRVAWYEIEYVDSDTQYERHATRGSKATYRAYLGVGGKSIDLTETFLGQFADPAGIIKLIRKNSGGTVQRVEMPGERDE